MLLLSFNGQTAAVNQDGSLNGPGNPARKSSLVVLYATGEGRVLPDAEDGSITTSPDRPDFPYQCSSMAARRKSSSRVAHQESLPVRPGERICADGKPVGGCPSFSYGSGMPLAKET